MRQTLIALILALISGCNLAPAYAQDAIDLHTVAVHDSPADVASWPATVRIERLTMSSPKGLAFDTSGIPASWDFHVPGWGVGSGCPADGCVLYTVWAIVRVNNGLHTAGFIQMWSGREATGAPILSDFHKNWAYACDRWADLCQYMPQVGDLMGFFLTAGNARDTLGVTSRQERSNVVLVRLPANDEGVFEFMDPTTPPTPPVVTPPVVTPPTPPTPPVVPPAAPLPSTDLSYLIQQQAMDHAILLKLQQDLIATRQDIAEFRDAVKSKWTSVVNNPIFKYGLAALTGFLATHKWGGQ